MLMGQAMNIIEYSQRPQNIVSYMASLPTLAALGWYHHKANAKGLSIESFTDAAWYYAQNEYLHALAQGSEISTDERNRVADQLAEFTGIPAAYYRDHNLRISKEQYRKELFKEQHLLLGRSDGRYLAPVTEKGLAADPAEPITTGIEQLFAEYLHKDLALDWPDTYTAIADSGDLDAWNWGAASPFASWAYTDRMLKAMQVNPHFRLMICNGYYDLQTTVGGARYAVQQAGWPADRVSLHFYEGGHTAYTNEDAARKSSRDIHEFLATPR